MTIIKKDAEPRRPPEFRAELTRLNAEDLASSSSNSSDNEDVERSPKPKKVTLKAPPKSPPKDLPTGLPPNGKPLSRSGSKEENLFKRGTSPLNGKLNGDSKITPNGSLDRRLQHSTPFLQVRCLASSDQRSVSNKPSVPFVFSGPKRSAHIRDLKLECEAGKLPFQLSGGAEYGQLLWIGAILHPDPLNKLQVGDILLSANKLLLSGKTQIECVSFVSSVFKANNALEIEVISSNYVPIEIAKIFADKRWINLHVVIRDNALLHTCQYTTRPPQEGEIPGQDYHFVSIQEFHSLIRRDFFLEWTENSDGHLFGTPKPPNLLDSTTNAELRNGEMVQSSSPVSLRSGPLPSNWEIAYTELGEKYFIDHNSGTTQWQDPREQQSPLNKRSSTAEFPSQQTNGVSNGHNDVDEEELPEGWERIEDETHGVFYVDHINKRTQYEKPELPNKSEAPLRNGYTSTGITTSTARQHHHQRAESSQRLPPEPSYPPPIYHSTTPTTANHFEQPSPSMWRNGVSPSVKRRSQQQMQHQFTTDPSQLKGQLLTTRLYKSPTGFGFTLIGNDGGNAAPEFIQIKSILPGGPAALDNLLHPGDVLVFVDNECMLGSSQDEACGLLRSIPPGEPVTLQVCRGYPLVLDPTNKIISLGNMYTPQQYPSKWHDQHDILITKGPKGFGFTITDSPQGQRVKNILYPDQCPNLFENDLILEVDGKNALSLSHAQLVQMMQDFPVGYQTYLLISRSSPKNRSRTPTAGFKFGEKNRTTPLPVLPRSKTPAPQTRAFGPQSFGNTTVPRNYGTSRQNNIYEELNRVRLNSDSYVHQPHYGVPATPNYVPLSSLAGRHSAVPILFANDPKYQLVTVNLLRKIDGFGFGFRLVGGSEMDAPLQVGNLIKGGAAHQDGRLQEGDEIVEINDQNVVDGRHDVAVQMIKQAAAIGHVKLVVRRLKENWSNGYNNYTSTFTDYPKNQAQNSHTYDVHLVKNPNEDFGCTLVTIEHRFIGRIIPGTPAERCGRLRAGDCVAMINGFTTTHMTHRQVIDYIKSCGNQVTFTIDPTITMPRYAQPPVNGTVNGPIEAEDAVYTTSNPYGTLTNGHKTHNGHNGHNGHYQSNGNIVMGSGLDYLNQDDKDYKLINVELSRGIKNFGFSIRGGFEFGRMPLFILRIAEDGPAAQEGSLRVGDQLMSINGQETTGMTHERAINLIREQPIVRLVVKRKLLTP